MWALLPMISLLIRATDGSLQIHHDSTTVPGTQNLANDSSDMITDNRSAEPAIGGAKMWKREASEDKGDGKEAIDSRYTVPDESTRGIGNDLGVVGTNADLDEYEKRETDSNVRIVSKRTEAAESQFSLPTKLEEFPKISQERKQPWLYWSGGKRLSLYSPSISNIRRPIRVPFNSWGGKRGYAYSMSNAGTQIKRTKLTFDRHDRDASIDGLDETKRVSEISKVGCKIPFDSWGGKRTEKSIEREQLLLSSDDANAFGAAKGGFVDEWNIGDTGDEKHASRGRNDISGMHDNLDGKWNYFLHAILPWICNKTRQDDYTSEEENGSANDWTHDYRKKQRGPGNNGKRTFDPWGGKRSLRVYTVRFGNDHSPMPMHSAKRGNAFIPLDGYK